MDTTLFTVEIWVNHPLLRKVEQKHPFFYNFVRKKNHKYSLILYNLIKKLYKIQNQIKQNFAQLFLKVENIYLRKII
jgi:hypothetical protein